MEKWETNNMPLTKETTRNYYKGDESYPRNRQQMVKIDNRYSGNVTTACGAPQGTALGPTNVSNFYK